jgi:ATP-dependent DNA helicase RecG
VLQRSILSRKGVQPHLLTMSATPIPRSLALTAFGELDISIIDELPPGRVPVTTKLVVPENVARAWAFVRKQLEAGRQAYVVYPLVEESETMPLRAASQEVARLAEHDLRGRSIALLHGRMKPDQKQKIMKDFHDGRIDVLVATTVVEVGLDVANATVMIIQHAERYGLSQLHQLRGRIGRGREAGHCLLMTDSAEPAARRRLEVLVRTADGFEVAEEDLRHRGPGEMIGTRQHGSAGLRVARFPEDFDLLELASQDARTIVALDSRLRDPTRAALKTELVRRYGDSLALLDAG